MGLFRDIQTALREGLDELLNAGATRDEVDEVIELLESDLAEARSVLDLAAQDERRIRSRIDSEQRDAERLQGKAQQAVDHGDDEAGRELIRRRRRALRGIEILEQQWAEHQRLVAMLHDHIEEIEDKLQELRLRRDFLRTRGRVSQLRERYERYRRDFDLDGLTGPDHEAEEEAGLGEQAMLPDGPEETDVRPAHRLMPGDAAPAPAPEPRGGRAEMPHPEPAEPETHHLRAHPPGEEGVAEEVWDLPRRDLRLERERMLHSIERRQRSHSFDAEIEAELKQLKGEPPEPEEEPVARPEAPAEPKAEAGEGGGDEDGPAS